MRNALLISCLILCAGCGEDTESGEWRLTETVDFEDGTDMPEVPICDEFPEQYEFEPDAGDTVRNDIAVDVGGCPHVSFHQDGQLKYARWNGESWRVETIAVDAPNWTHALAVDQAGRAHIAFDTVGRPQVKLASRTQNGWGIEELSQNYAWDLQFDFDEAGEPLVMVMATPEQYSGAGGELLALTKSDDGWRRQKIELGANARTMESPIVFGRDGPALSITTDEWDTGSNIRWVERVGEEWSVSRVAAEGDELDSLRTLTAPGSPPHIIACTSDPYDVDRIEHARPIEGVWSTQTLDRCGQQSACWCADAATDDAGRVHLVYLRPDDDLGSSFDRLIHATFQGNADVVGNGGWQKNSLGIYHRSGDTSLALDPRTGAPHILATLRDDDGDRKTVYLPPVE